MRKGISARNEDCEKTARKSPGLGFLDINLTPSFAQNPGIVQAHIAIMKAQQEIVVTVENQRCFHCPPSKYAPPTQCVVARYGGCRFYVIGNL